MRDVLKKGRESHRRAQWGDAYRSLSLADQATPLGREDLELFATSAYLIGRDQEFQKITERAYHAHLEADDSVRAAGCAFWIGLSLLFGGKSALASGWLARAGRLVEGRDCAEQGYLQVPVAELHLAQGNNDAAYTAAVSAAEIGGRFADADLIACARHLQGRALIQQGKVAAGLVLLDEAMLAVTAGELSPIMTGLVYCSVIEVCQQVYALSRAQEWTSELATWCDRQPDMIAFSGTCLLHRAEIMRFHGAWADAKTEALRAFARFAQRGDLEPPAAALYQQAEMHRLCGEFERAEEAYCNASRSGWEPQPGFALLRMAQGRTDAAAAAIRRAVSAAADPLERAKLLPAQIEIALAAGDLQQARRASRELDTIAEQFNRAVLDAMAAQGRGAVELAQGNAQAALISLRRALEVWQQVKAPYESARVHVLIGQARILLEDIDGGRLAFDAARIVFERLGAAPDLASLGSLRRPADSVRRHGLTTRQLQVLRLIAAGKTNRAIADELFLSLRTIDRHVSNILSTLDVPSRAAATAYAYEHKLL